MRHCRHCNVDVDNSFNLCPYCGQVLESGNPVTAPHSSAGDASGRQAESRQRASSGTKASAYGPEGQTSHGQSGYTFNNSIPFQTLDGSNLILNGQIVESNTQQYYQSKLTKIIQALFYGEPYQLSHTTFVTVFRIEEHVQSGFAEQARDVVVYGQLQNVLSPGDDVTVVVHQKRNRLVAKSIIDHSSETQVIPQRGMISAGMIRIAVLIPLAILVFLLLALITIPSSVILNALFSILFPVVLIAIGISWLKGKFKKK